MTHLHRALIVTAAFVVLPITFSAYVLHLKGAAQRQPRPMPAPVVQPMTWNFLEGREVPLNRHRLPMPAQHVPEVRTVTF